MTAKILNMEPENLLGRVVVCNSGHDRGLFSVIVKITPERYYIADGRRRKISQPKAKNRRHFTLVNCRYDGDVSMALDRDLRRLLHRYNFNENTRKQPASGGK